MSKDIIQKSIKCLAKAKLETTYAVARDIVLDELINLQKIEKDHQKLNGELREEINFLKLNNPEANIEHFRVIKENKRKINNLRAENKRLKDELERWKKKYGNL